MSISNKTYFGALEPPFQSLTGNTSNLTTPAIEANMSALSSITTSYALYNREHMQLR